LDDLIVGAAHADLSGKLDAASSPLITKPPEELPVAIVLRLMATLQEALLSM
jgi:hypothetical protein